MTPPARRTTPPRADEIEGFLVGVAHRVAAVAEPERAVLLADLERARAARDAGDLATAEATLLTLERRMDELEGEPELAEFPRGLVGYVPLGDRGHATPPEEDPLRNRVVLIERLRDVRASAGWEVEPSSVLLREARAALDAGDRTTARARVDRAHALLERDPRAATEE